MTDLPAVENIAQWQTLKMLVVERFLADHEVGLQHRTESMFDLSDASGLSANKSSSVSYLSQRAPNYSL